MDIKATLETKISKAGTEYQVIELQLTDTYKKSVFLEKSELELLKIYNSDKSKSKKDNFDPFK